MYIKYPPGVDRWLGSSAESETRLVQSRGRNISVYAGCRWGAGTWIYSLCGSFYRGHPPLPQIAAMCWLGRIPPLSQVEHNASGLVLVPPAHGCHALWFSVVFQYHRSTFFVEVSWVFPAPRSLHSLRRAGHKRFGCILALSCTMKGVLCFPVLFNGFRVA